MTRSELITAAIQAEAIEKMAGSRRDAITANHRAWACRIASLMLAEQVDRIPEA